MIIAVLIVAACDQEEDKGIPKPPPQTVLLGAQIEPLPAPNQYRVHLKWKMKEDPAAWRLRREVRSEGAKPLVTLDGSEREYVDTTVSAGETYKYYLETSEGSAKAEVTALVYSDLVIQGVMTPESFAAHRLFFTPGSKIRTEGKDVQINVEEIISDGGTVESFHYGQTAPEEQPGRAGRRIEIRAKRASGLLYVTAQGENGGRAARGASITQPAERGPRGVNGQCGYRGTEVNCESLTADNLELWRRLAATPGPTQHVYQDALSKLYCKVQPGDGGPGLPGKQGEKGGTGGAGGDSGEIYVRVENAANFEVKPNLYPGHGGEWAPGGNGGPGGPGGDPGRQDHLKLCRLATQGPDGPNGLMGPWGEKGKEGRLQTFCLHLGSTRLGTCDQDF